jgi:hypothetical protein
VDATCTCCGETAGATVQFVHHPEVTICCRCLDWLNRQRDRQVRAHTGGWTVVNTDPIFAVADVARATDHYERLGFEISRHEES